MTGTEIIAEGKLILGETTSTAAQLQSQLWTRHVYRAADYLARQTRSLYLGCRHDVTNNAQEYCLPFPPFEIRAATVRDQQGNIWPLAFIRPEDADDQYPWWRQQAPNAPLQGTPTFAIMEGLNRFKVYPIPDYTAALGFEFEGYFGVGSDWVQATELPFPEMCFHEAVVYGACVRRCREMMSSPDYANKLPEMKSAYLDLENQCYRISCESSEARRNAGPPSPGKPFGAWSSFGGWAYGGLG